MNLQAAIAYLSQKIGDFLDLAPRIAKLQHDAAQLTAALRQAGRHDEADAARELVVKAGELLVDYGKWRDRLESVAQYIPGASAVGLGAPPVAIPIAAGAVLVAASIAMSNIFRRLNSEEMVVKGLVEGSLSADEAMRILDGLERPVEPMSLTDTIKTLGVLALALWGAKEILPALRRGG